ncbi:MAG TPA: ABC transporter substrate-binding protein [Nitrospiraceae bacterium]
MFNALDCFAYADSGRPLLFDCHTVACCTNFTGEQIGRPLGYAAMTQILEAIQRAGTTDTAALIKALEGHEFDGLKEGKSAFRASDHQHGQDVLVGEAFGKEFGLGHYKILATVLRETVAGKLEQTTCRF